MRLPPAPTPGRRSVAPYGAWASPVSAQMVAAGGLKLDAPQVDGGDRYWLEARPAEQGRVVLVRRSAAGLVTDVTPPPFSVRTRVHEYGGGAYLVAGGTVWFSNFADQRLWRTTPGAAGAGAPVPLTTPPGGGIASVRFADARLTTDGHWLVCVRETHRGSTAAEVVNELVAVRADCEPGTADEWVLATGRDFYSFPRISPDGGWLAWTCWDHPNMPWDGTECWVARLVPGAAGPGLAEALLVAGGPAESVFQPEWAPAGPSSGRSSGPGSLYYVSDRNEQGWWRLCRHDLSSGESAEVTGGRGEWGRPQWVFGLSTYAFLGDGRIVGVWSQDGTDHLGLVEPASGTVTELDVGYSAISHLRSTGDGVVFAGAGPLAPAAIAEVGLNPAGDGAISGRARALDPGGSLGGARAELARSRTLELDLAGIAVPEPIEFPTSGGHTAHALYYPPASASFCAPEGERCPLVVISHGGPTSATSPALSLTVQYFTSRGLAVVDVNYSGSTGYGRAYRDRLRHKWGLLDVDDCVNAALYLVGRGDADATRLAIRGSSAGGFTTLCALAFHPVFAVGASYYGVADAAALCAHTHKFESRYLDSLIGPWPQAAAVYRERSPLFHTETMTCPVILFQGADDPVVPPSQAESLVAALRARGVRHEYVRFEGEQHGFRRADTLRRCLVEELDFYAEVLGFSPHERGGPI